MNVTGTPPLRSLLSKLCYSAVGVAAALAALLAGLAWSKMRHKAAMEQQVEHCVSLPPNDATNPHIAPFAPTGMVVSDGVTFRCNGGVVRAKGLYALRQSPEARDVLAVPVNRRGSRLHLLQAAENCMGAKPGVAYGRVRLHYGNGEAKDFELVHQVHGRDWWVDPRKRGANDPLPHSDTTTGWEKMTPDGYTIRLYHTRFENPLPSETIVSVDFLSGLGEPSLMVFGFTVSDEVRPLAVR
jgi:hypothetical protein